MPVGVRSRLSWALELHVLSWLCCFCGIVCFVPTDCVFCSYERSRLFAYIMHLWLGMLSRYTPDALAVATAVVDDYLW